MCFVLISKPTVTFTLYNINQLIFITKIRSVYSMVETGSLNKTVYASSVTFSTIYYMWYTPLLLHMLPASYLV